MDVLRKLKGSTLMETLIATVLVVLIFMMSGMVLNNLFSSNIKGDTFVIENIVEEIDYNIENDKISLPYFNSINGWDLEVYQNPDIFTEIKFKATNETLNNEYSTTRTEKVW